MIQQNYLLGFKINSTDARDLVFDTEEDMTDHLQYEEFQVVNILAGIVFDSNFPTDGSIPKSIVYKIRWA